MKVLSPRAVPLVSYSCPLCPASANSPRTPCLPLVKALAQSHFVLTKTPMAGRMRERGIDMGSGVRVSPGSQWRQGGLRKIILLPKLRTVAMW